MKIIIFKIIITVILCLALTLVFSFANEYSEYVGVISKYYESKQKDVEVINGWELGLQDYKAVLDHLVNNFEFVDGVKTTEDKIIIAGILTTTAFCTRDGCKIRVIQRYGMAILMTKDKKFEKFLKLTEVSHIVKFGWNGKDV
jgi:hypothetical protein